MSDKATAVVTEVEVQPVAPRIGAVIGGVDLAGELSDEVIASIRTALLVHRVVFFREQHLDGGGQVRFAKRLGPLTLAHPTLPSSAEDPALYDLDSQTGSAANHWHTDVTFVQQPPTSQSCGPS